MALVLLLARRYSEFGCRASLSQPNSRMLGTRRLLRVPLQKLFCRGHGYFVSILFAATGTNTKELSIRSLDLLYSHVSYRSRASPGHSREE